MASDVSAQANALDASVVTEGNPPDPDRVLRRLHNDVEACRRALALIEDAPESVERKYAKFEAVLSHKEAELAEANAMVTAARQALADAESALAEVG